MWWPTWLRRSSRADPGPPLPSGLLRLGSAATAGAGVGAKASNLDRATASGIDVPTGFVVLAEVDDESLDELITSALGHPTGHGVRHAVRSAFSAEDGASSSHAGWFDTVLDLEAADVADAIRTVRTSAKRRTGSFRTDVLVMTMVCADVAGVAFSEPGTYDDLVNVTDGLADRLVGGEVEGERELLPRIERADDGWRRRLQDVLRHVRETFGDEPWDLEWADDGDSCWLLQLRPVTAPTTRDELLTLANHAEILPELPSTLMTSVIERAGPDLFAWYRRRVPGLPSERDFLHVVAGRPMINLSLLEDMMRHLGLPTELVAESIGGGGGADRPIAPMRLLRRSPSLARLGLAQIAAVARSRGNERHVAGIGSEGANSFGEALDQLHRAYVTLVTGMFPLSSAIGPPLAVLRRAGTLTDHAATHQTVTTRLANALDDVARARPDDRARRRSAFLAEFGHRGVYESDIARPRFADAPERILTADVGVTRVLPSRSTRRALRWWVTRPIWWLAARPLAARERYRHEAMRSFAAIRTSLVSLARRSTAAGQLPDPDALWLLDVDTVRSLDAGAVIDAGEVASRVAERERLAELTPPHVVHRLADPSTWAADTDDTATGWTGLPLTTGSVHGRAWVLREPVSSLPDDFDSASTVLVARSIDAGWIETLRLVAGVVVEIGGDLSHGSILVRELGIPSITNTRGVLGALATGDEVVLDAGGGRLRRASDCGLRRNSSS